MSSIDATPDVIDFEDFMKVDIRAGFITAAERVPKSDKLLKLTVDLVLLALGRSSLASASSMHLRTSFV